MKRPFALLGGTAFAFLLFASVLGAAAASVVIPVCAGLGFCALFACVIVKICFKKSAKLSGKKRPRAFSVLVSAAAIFLTGSVCLHNFVAASVPLEKAEQLDGVKAKIRGTVMDCPREQYHRAYYKILVESVSVDGRALSVPNFTARISTQSPLSCQPYDRVECTVKFSAFNSDSGLYSTRSSYIADGYAVSGYIADYRGISVIAETGVSPAELAVRWRHALGRSIDKQLPQREAGLIRAILLGEREQAADEDYNNFKRIGASHLLVISGLHMTALAACFSLVFNEFRLRKGVKNLLTAAAIFLFLAVTGFPVSAVRSAVMYIVILLAGCMGRRADSVNSLGLAVLLICLTQPFSGGDMGFALSALSTLGILLLTNKIHLRFTLLAGGCTLLKRITRPITASLAVTFSAMVFTLPLQMTAFGGVSLLAPIAGLLLVPTCTLLLYTSLAAAVLGVVPAACSAAAPFGLLSGWLARVSLDVANSLARIPGTYLSLSEAVWQVVLLGVLIFALIWYFGKSRGSACAALIGIVLLFCGGTVLESSSGAVTIAAPHDSSAVVMLQNRKAVVLSLGGYKTSAAADILMRGNVKKIELLCLPVRDADAREAAVNILQSIHTECIALPEDAYLGRDLIFAGENSARSYLDDGNELNVLDGVTIKSENDMTRLVLDIYGISVIVEVESGAEAECDLLFTTSANSSINSAFTVCQNDAIMDALTETDLGADSVKTSLPEGSYLFPGEGGLYCDIYRDGTINFRGESVCLK